MVGKHDQDLRASVEREGQEKEEEETQG